MLLNLVIILFISRKSLRSDAIIKKILIPHCTNSLMKNMNILQKLFHRLKFMEIIQMKIYQNMDRWLELKDNIL